MAIADELIAILGFQIEGEEQARRFESRLSKIQKNLSSFVATAVRLSGIAAGAMVTGFSLLGRSVINTSAQFETFQATLETIEGSSEKAKASLDWIAEFGKTTPYEVAEVTDAFVKLKAYGIDPVANEALRTLGDTAAAMGKTLNQAVEMFADASTGEFERLKEFGMKASTKGEQVTFSWTKNGKELTKTVKKNATEIRAFLLETMGDRFAGAMDRQSRTFKGITSNLGDSWVDFQRRIGDAGFFASVINKLKSLLDVINRLDEEGKLDQWAKTLSDNLTWAADMIWAVFTRIAQNITFLAERWDSLRGYAYTLMAAFGLLIARAFPMVTVFLLLGLAVDDVLAYMQGGESIIGDFIKWLQDLTGVSEGTAEAIAGIGLAILGLGLISPSLVLGTLKAALVRLVPMILAGIGAALTAAAATVGWPVVVAGIIATALIAYFWDELVSLWQDNDWSQLGADAANSIWEGMKGIGASIRDWFVGLFSNPFSNSTGWDSFSKLFKNPHTSASVIAADRAARNVTNNSDITINQTVTQATDAPARAAEATGKAVQQSVTRQRTQIEQGPTR